jgi:hypothetical protein
MHIAASPGPGKRMRKQPIVFRPTGMKMLEHLLFGVLGPDMQKPTLRTVNFGLYRAFPSEIGLLKLDFFPIYAATTYLLR